MGILAREMGCYTQAFGAGQEGKGFIPAIHFRDVRGMRFAVCDVPIVGKRQINWQDYDFLTANGLHSRIHSFVRRRESL
jgi:hypothetical protein